MVELRNWEWIKDVGRKCILALLAVTKIISNLVFSENSVLYS